MTRRRALWTALMLPYKIPSAIAKIASKTKRYDETLNSCQDFAVQLAASIDFDTGISEKRTKKIFGIETRITYYNATSLPLSLS